MKKIILCLILITMSINIYAGRANDIESSVNIFLKATEAEINRILSDNAIDLKSKESKSYYSNILYNLNFINDIVYESTNFPNEIELILYPYIISKDDKNTIYNDSLEIFLEIDNEDFKLSKKVDEKLLISLRIISKDHKVKETIIENIDFENINQFFIEEFKLAEHIYYKDRIKFYYN